MAYNKKKILPLRIAIDGNEANVKNRVGSNVYAYEILKALEQITYRKRNINVTVLLSSDKLSDLPRRRKNWDYQVIAPKKFWTQLALPLYLFKHSQEFDVFYTPGHYAPRFSAIPYVSSIMDLAFLKYPHQFIRKDFLQLKKWTAYSVKNAAKIVTISQFSKNEILKHYKINQDKIVVAYPAVQAVNKISPSQTKAILKKLKISGNFLLYVGTLQPRKNLVRLIKAFENLCFSIDKEHFNDQKTPNRKGRKSRLSQLTDLQLVIAGKIGWLAKDIIDQVNQSPYKNRIILTGFVSEKDKQVLVDQALSLILIGFYEGFGIPPLEAIQTQTIPVVSKTSSLREVVGNAGILVDPTNLDSITLGLKEVLSLSAKQKAVLLKNGRDQLKKFSWESTARTILRILEEVHYSQKSAD